MCFSFDFRLAAFLLALGCWVVIVFFVPLMLGKATGRRSITITNGPFTRAGLVSWVFVKQKQDVVSLSTSYGTGL